MPNYLKAAFSYTRFIALLCQIADRAPSDSLLPVRAVGRGRLAFSLRLRVLTRTGWPLARGSGSATRRRQGFALGLALIHRSIREIGWSDLPSRA